MQERSAKRVAAIRGTTSAALLLAFCCAPAYSAGTDSLCAQSVAPEINFDIPVEELAISMVDLGASVSVPEEDFDTSENVAFRTPIVPTAPRVERILREIFDESAPADHEDSAATPSSSPNAASLAELTAPVLLEQTRDIDGNIDDEIDAAKLREADKDGTGVTTSIPGLSEEELTRYRRQMFRTDI